MDEKNSFFKQGLLGVFIGLAVIIPGLSGAQIAIIFKLYDKLMAALAHIFTKKSILFLIPIAIGGVIGFLAGLLAIKELLAISTIAVVCFFAGLMVGGMPSVFDEVIGTKFKNIYFLNAIIGIIIPIIISFLAIKLNFDLSALLTNPPFYFYFILIAIGILLSLTQLIPGLSATSILLSFGLYTALLDCLNINVLFNDYKIIIIFLMLIIGIILGVLLISKFINRCLNNYKIGFYYLIIGLCFGSIFVMFYNPEMYDIYINQPSTFNIELIVGGILFIIGVLIIYLIYKFTKNKESIN